MPIVKDTMDASLARIQKRLVKEVPAAALKTFKATTPIRTGNARRKTHLRGGNVVHANYKYASFLDAGSSKQARKGMSEPTTRFLNKLVDKIMRK